jgi:hypothetical protein
VAGLRGSVIGHRPADETGRFELLQRERKPPGRHGQLGAQLGEATRLGKRCEDRERPFLQPDILPAGEGRQDLAGARSDAAAGRREHVLRAERVAVPRVPLDQALALEVRKCAPERLPGHAEPSAQRRKAAASGPADLAEDGQ